MSQKKLPVSVHAEAAAVDAKTKTKDTVCYPGLLSG